MVYEANHMKSPAMRGITLRTTARILETAGLRRVVGWKVLKDAGIWVARNAVATDSPQMRPPVDKFTECEPDLTELPAPAPAGVITAYQLTEAYRSGEATPTEIVRTILSNISKSDYIFTSVKTDEVIKQAEESTERWLAGTSLGELDGIPVAVKECIAMTGHPTRCGTKMDFGPFSANSVLVNKLVKSGAIIIGQTNMHEIGIGVSGLNPFNGTPRNPYDNNRVTGGSSSGPAAAVSRGFIPFAVGTDGGGSIRIPAALCGVVGLKPTWGRVSGKGSAQDCWSVAHTGPIGATVGDCALLYTAIAGSETPQPEPTLKGTTDLNLAGVKIGIYDPWFQDADKEIVASCRTALTHLEEAGTEIIQVDIPELELVQPVHLVTIVSEMATSQEKQLAKNPRVYGAETRAKLQLSRHLRPDDYLHAQRLRTRICGHFDDALTNCDVIITPSTASTATPIHKSALSHGEMDIGMTEKMMRFMQIPNLNGYPAISVPAGYDSNGLPIGLQIIGDAWQEALLFRIAAVVESNVEKMPPQNPINLL